MIPWFYHFCFSRLEPTGLWDDTVYCVDSSLTGFGVMTNKWPLDEVRKVGRLSERSRWIKGGVQARHRALGRAVQPALFEDLGNFNTVLEPAWEVSEDFTEVPCELMNPDSWSSSFGGNWFYKANILILEARSTVKAVERCGAVESIENRRVLVLGDNLGVASSFARRRAKNFELLLQVRRACAVGLARGIRFYYRWVPSELNVADGESRPR